MGDFRDFRAVLDEMAAWDATGTRTRGFDAEALLRICYGATAGDIKPQFSLPRTAVYLARQGAEVAGCAGFTGLEPGIAGLAKVFVRPEFRGLGLGAKRVGRVGTEMTQSRYRGARIETTNFMTGAIAICRRFGFEHCPPFRDPMADPGPIRGRLPCSWSATCTTFEQGIRLADRQQEA